MKNLIIICISIFFFAGCKKENISTLAGRASGSYTIKTTKLNNQNVSGLTGSIKITSLTAETVKVKVTYALDKSSDFFDINELKLSADGDDIDLKQGSDLVGTVSGNNLLFYLAGDNGTVEFQALK